MTIVVILLVATHIAVGGFLTANFLDQEWAGGDDRGDLATVGFLFLIGVVAWPLFGFLLLLGRALVALGWIEK